MPTFELPTVGLHPQAIQAPFKRRLIGQALEPFRQALALLLHPIGRTGQLADDQPGADPQQQQHQHHLKQRKSMLPATAPPQRS